MTLVEKCVNNITSPKDSRINICAITGGNCKLGPEAVSRCTSRENNGEIPSSEQIGITQGGFNNTDKIDLYNNRPKKGKKIPDGFLVY